jgi:hypothetical protein
MITVTIVHRKRLKPFNIAHVDADVMYHAIAAAERVSHAIVKIKTIAIAKKLY